MPVPLLPSGEMLQRRKQLFGKPENWFGNSIQWVSKLATAFCCNGHFRMVVLYACVYLQK